MNMNNEYSSDMEEVASGNSGGANSNSDSSSDDRKDGSNNADPTNSGRWTDEEHERFLKALETFGKNWNCVHKFVGSRSSAQTRSHA